MACVRVARGQLSFNLNATQNNIALIQSIPFCTTIIRFTFEHCQVISVFTWTVVANSLRDAIKYFVKLRWDVFMMKLLRCTGSGHTQEILVQCTECRGRMAKHPWYCQRSSLLQYSPSPLCLCILRQLRHLCQCMNQHVFP